MLDGENSSEGSALEHTYYATHLSILSIFGENKEIHYAQFTL